MKRPITVLAVLWGVTLAAMMLVSCGSNELIRSNASAGLNGGFELMQDGYPINWAFGPNPETLPPYQVSVDTARVAEGSKSLRLVSTQDNQTKAFRSVRVPIGQGQDYRIAFSVINEGCSLRVNRIVMNAWGTTNMRSQIIAQTSETTVAWVTFEEILTPAEGEALVLLIFLIDGVGTLWCDDVRIEEYAAQE